LKAQSYADLHDSFNRPDVHLATIIYLHRISDNRMSASMLKNLKSFKDLCGMEAMPRIVIATTMWSEINQVEVGVRREELMRKSFWKDMQSNGCRLERFEDSYESAWKIIGSLAENRPQEIHRPTPPKQIPFIMRIRMFFSTRVAR
jgi:hypothetical protein